MDLDNPRTGGHKSIPGIEQIVEESSEILETGLSACDAFVDSF
jgi:hypothetical protein